MLIAWLNDYKLSALTGGAELSNYYWIEYGRKLGYDIVEIDPSDQIPVADYYVFANVTRFKEEELLRLKPYSCVIAGLPLASPELYRNAKTVCFMAPSHLYRNRGLTDKGFYSAPYIDHGLFKPTGEPRKDAGLYLGWLYEHKGISRIIDYSIKSKIRVDFYGNGDQATINAINAAGLDVYPAVPFNEAAKIYNQYKRFVWILGRYGSYGRTLVEALLCDMKLCIDSKNFGLFSYPWDFTSRDAIVEALEANRASFWDQLLKNM